MTSSMEELYANITDTPDVANSRRYTAAFTSLTLIIAVVGFVGNVLCVVVMLHKTMRGLPFAVYSGVLAISDSILLINRVVSLMTRWKPESIPLSDFTCGFLSFSLYFCNHFSSLILVHLTIERMFAVLLPLKCREIVTRRRAFVILLITGFVLGGVNMHANWTFYHNVDHSACTWRSKYHHSIYQTIFVWTDILLFFLIPATLIIALNSVIIYKLCSARKDHGHNKKQRKAVVMLFTVSIAFVVLTSPIAGRDLYYLLTHRRPHGDNLLHLVPYTMWMLNYAVNFYLYSLAGSKVRNVLFGYCIRTKELSTSQTVSKVYDTKLWISGVCQGMVRWRLH